MTISEATTDNFVRGSSNPPPVHEPAPDLPAPVATVGAVGWIRANLFSGILQSILTLSFGALAVYAIWNLMDWAVFNATFLGDGREACNVQKVAAVKSGGTIGACWVFVGVRFKQFIFGFYPEVEYWRPIVVFILGLAGIVYALIDGVPHRKWVVLFLFVPFPVIAHGLLSGGLLSVGGHIKLTNLIFFGVICGIAVYTTQRMEDLERVRRLTVIIFLAAALSLFLSNVYSMGWDIDMFEINIGVDTGLEHVETSRWGGFLLTLVIAAVGIVASLPIGILLALGRRSQMPAIRMICIMFIEFVRAVPLITILFMASVILPLFLPPGSNFDKLLRALIGVALFASAYMAETIRGGLQALTAGQYEAAQALGLRYWPMMRLIILPQALKIVIPAIVSSFIGLFKDTTLVLIIGLTDLLAMTQMAVADAKWIGLQTEGYFFAALVFFVFCFGMSRYSMYLERRLDTGYSR